jgi:queuine tRNA-ribosyltransferase
MYPEQVRETGADILLGNTYHLMLRPGAERVAALGGLHRFMDWERPILTDSGGFQVMSLAKLRKLTENGVTFRSHIDGSAHELTPERSIEIQTLLDSDIIMQLDECIALPAERQEMERAMELSLRWGQRSKDAFGQQPHRALFGIVQGGDDPDLRSRSAAGLRSIGFDGYAVGGLAVGEPQETMFRVLDELCPELPADRPRYLMGVGKPDDILGGIGRGIDMFDCVHPTRAGRHGHVYTRFGVINLKNARHKDDPRPLDEASPNQNCRRFSRAYLHHLVRTEEILGAMVLSQVNLAYYQELVTGARAAIAAGTFVEFATTTRDGWDGGDLPPL